MSSKHDSKSREKTDQNILDLVLADHVKVKQLYQEIQAASDHEADEPFQKMCWEIALHAVAEELVLYPLQESIDKEGIALATESREDHEKTKEALKDLDGKSLKEHGVRQKVDLMMKDLLEHIGKEETEDLVKLKKDVSKEKLHIAGRDFEQVKSLVPDVAASNQARSEKQVDRSEKDNHFKTPMALLLASKEKLQEIIGKHGPTESVSVNKPDVKGHSHEKADGGGQAHYNLRHRDDKGHSAEDGSGGKTAAAETSGEEIEGKSSHEVEISRQKNEKAHANGQKNGPGADGAKNLHGKRGKDDDSVEASGRKRLSDSHGEGMEVDAGDV